MGFTHQGHNIPWQVLAGVYVDEPEYLEPGGGKLGSKRLKVRDDWPQDRVVKAVRHFARRLACTVDEFGRTELLKYKQRPRPPSNISDNLLLYEEQHFDDVLTAGELQQRVGSEPGLGG